MCNYIFTDARDDTHSSGESSDTEDEEDIQGNDDKELEEEEYDFNTSEGKQTGRQAVVNGTGNSHLEGTGDTTTSKRPVSRTSFFTYPPLPEKQEPGNSTTESQVKSLEALNLSDKRVNSVDESNGSEDVNRKFSEGQISNTQKRKTTKEDRKISDPGARTEYQSAQDMRLKRQGAFKASRIRKEDTQSPPPSAGEQVWANRR